MAHIPIHYLAVLICGSTFLTGLFIITVCVAIYKHNRAFLDPIFENMLDNYFDNE